MTDIVVRYATEADLPEVWTMLRHLATSLKSSADFTVSAAELREALFGPAPEMSVLVAARAFEVCGIATFYPIYSTWRGRRGIHLEDLYVLPAYRHAGVGSMLVAGLARLAIEREYTHVRWSVHSWNTQAVNFYESVGAQRDRYTDFYDLSGPELIDAAGGMRSVE
ncbi:GNAT family N-acetyltransferase [Nocardia brasiliensis]|uniref:GNAT family N-acetyltransferase n=1 Tax=Nocardia brasiliensis TaxID=37326 RepID=UPI0024540FD7|nr:GNAT family N-acetyltransferase [Nocardia brasiliensis]